MSVALQKVIADVEKQINDTNEEIDYHHRRLRGLNEKVLALKESLAEIKALEEKL